MYTGFLHLHSLLRWVLLILLLVMIYRAFTGKRSGRVFDATDRKLSLFTMISAHLQLVIGLMLYMMNGTVSAALANMGEAMKDPLLRFWAVEHLLTMIIGIVLITLGHILAKKATSDAVKFQKIFVFYLIGLILILSRIPWPFMEVGQGRGWL
ncbi:MAG: cytochrome B [Bacteroidota bacterium]